MSLLSNLSDVWQNADQIDTRQRIQRLIFPEGIEFDGTGYRTAVTLSLFNYLQPSFVRGVSDYAEGRQSLEPLFDDLKIIYSLKEVISL